jgi:hypothetical protein
MHMRLGLGLNICNTICKYTCKHCINIKNIKRVYHPFHFTAERLFRGRLRWQEWTLLLRPYSVWTLEPQEGVIKHDAGSKIQSTDLTESTINLWNITQELIPYMYIAVTILPISVVGMFLHVLFTETRLFLVERLLLRARHCLPFRSYTEMPSCGYKISFTVYIIITKKLNVQVVACQHPSGTPLRLCHSSTQHSDDRVKRNTLKHHKKGNVSKSSAVSSER